MDNATLVDFDISTGSQMLVALDKAGLRVKVALWAASSRYEDWKFIIASPKFDLEGRLPAYEQVAIALRGKFFNTLPPILILKMKDPFIKDLRHTFSGVASVEGMRLGGQSFGGNLIHNAYTYRIT